MPRDLNPPSNNKPRVSYKWVLYKIPPTKDPTVKGSPASKYADSHIHKFSRVKSGSVRSPFKPGTIAVNVFETTFGEGRHASDIYLRYMVAVFNGSDGKATPFYGYVRHASSGKPYIAVKKAGPSVLTSKFPGGSHTKAVWCRTHGHVHPLFENARSRPATSKTRGAPMKRVRSPPKRRSARSPTRLRSNSTRSAISRSALPNSISTALSRARAPAVRRVLKF